MNSLVITFDESNERLYKVSIQENKTSKGKKRARSEDDFPVRMFIFQRMPLATLAINAPSMMVKPLKRPHRMDRGCPKYGQNPFDVHLKECQKSKEDYYQSTFAPAKEGMR